MGEISPIVAARAACGCPTCGQPVDPLDLFVDRERGLVAFSGAVAKLTAKEMDFAAALIDAHPRLLTKEALLDLVYGNLIDGGPDIKIVDVFMCKLRKKLDEIGLVVTTSWGVGYGIAIADSENAAAIRRQAFKDAGRSKRVLDSADRLNVRQLHERGYSATQIAAQLRLTYRAAHEALVVIEADRRRRDAAEILDAARLPGAKKPDRLPVDFVQAAE